MLATMSRRSRWIATLHASAAAGSRRRRRSRRPHGRSPRRDAPRRVNAAFGRAIRSGRATPHCRSLDEARRPTDVGEQKRRCRRVGMAAQQLGCVTGRRCGPETLEGRQRGLQLERGRIVIGNRLVHLGEQCARVVRPGTARPVRPTSNRLRSGDNAAPGSPCGKRTSSLAQQAVSGQRVRAKKRRQRSEFVGRFLRCLELPGGTRELDEGREKPARALRDLRDGPKSACELGDTGTRASLGQPEQAKAGAVAPRRPPARGERQRQLR